MAKRKKHKAQKTQALTVPAALTAGGPTMAALQAQYEADMLAATTQQAALERDAQERQANATKNSPKPDKLKERLLAKETRSHRIAVDFGGGVAAQASTELINFLVRIGGEWSHDGWAAKNVDFLQSAPHLFLGSGFYFIEMLTRKNGQPPSMPRELFSEFTKIFGQLGFSNLVRALRTRYNAGKLKVRDYDALLQEKLEIERKYKQLKDDEDAEGGDERK